MTKLLTPDAVADRLDVSRRTAVKWMKSGELPAILMPSGDFRMDPADLARWEDERKEIAVMTAPNRAKRR